MSEKRKIFQKGNLKKLGVAATIAAAVLSAVPQQISARDKTPKPVKEFDLSCASEGDKKVYETMVNVLNIKLETDSAARLATRIMTDSRNFSGDMSDKYIQAAVELAMGDEYKAEMAEARRIAGVDDVDLTEVMKPKAHTTNTETINTPEGQETVTTTVVGDRTITEANINKTINIFALPPEQRAEYDMILAKIQTARELNKQRKNSLIDENLAINVFATPLQLREQALRNATRGVLFRDIDEQSFVAYSEKSGDGVVVAPTEKREKEIRKQVKKAGGMESFVKAGQKPTRKAAKTTAPINVMDFGRTI